MTDAEFATKIYCRVFGVPADEGDAHVRGILDALDALSGREQLALERYFRFGESYKQTSEMLGVTPAAARLVILSALDKLRHPARSRNMSVKALVEHWGKKLQNAESTIAELYAQLELAASGGTISQKTRAAIESRKLSIHELGLSPRVCDILINAGISTVEALMAPDSLDRLMKQRGFGIKSRDEIIAKMRRAGFKDWAQAPKIE